MHAGEASSRSVRCACGQVEIEAEGEPILAAVCYCDDCHEGARRIEALPGAGPVLDADGGCSYVLYRKDRFRVRRGAELLQPHKLRERTKTRRMVASCCNAALFLRFEDGKHWVTVFRSRLEGDPPPPSWRIGTKFKRPEVELPDDLPAYGLVPFAFVWKLLGARLAMWLGR